MSDIGPGDWVRAIKAWPSKSPGYSLFVGSIYQIAAVNPTERRCKSCGEADGAAIQLVGKQANLRPHEGYCRCFFARWPSDADEALRSEQSPYHEQEPTREPV